ncbi:MAG: hypothetical protein FWF41_07500 [Betaproteobacteria bacterium]|nr:hypothetical protein [Betaproteobacteria bacterium]
MGWHYFADTKQELIERLIATEKNSDGTTFKTIAHSLNKEGNILWTVTCVTHSDGNSRKFITCYLVEGEDGKWGWGYKDITESEHPGYYDCPLIYLKMVKDSPNQEWRAKVLADHLARKEYAKKAKQRRIRVQPNYQYLLGL